MFNAVNEVDIIRLIDMPWSLLIEYWDSKH